MNDEKNRTIKSMYWNQILGSFSSGLASPFIPYYAAFLNFNSPEMGFLQASQNLFPNVTQYHWGKLSDKFNNRIFFIIIGGIISSLMFIAFIVAKSPIFFITVVIIQSIFGAMVTPAWNALIGDISLPSKRASFIGKLSFYSNLSMLFAGVAFLFYTLIYSKSSISIYYLPFAIAGILGVLSSLIMLYAKEEKKFRAERKSSLFSILKKDNDFSYFMYSQLFYNFFMSISWPLLFITTVDVLKASYFQVAMLNLLGLISTVPFITIFGKIIDRTGTKWPIIASRFMFVPVPLVYAFANSVIDLYILNIVTGISQAITNVAFIAYILDAAPKEDRGKYVGLYNMLIGIVTFFGSILGGYLGIYLGLFNTYMVSFIGRFSGSFLFFKIREKRVYPQMIRLNPFGGIMRKR
ncbi:MAG: MFS transporter [Thermoplasmata archaeon]